MLKNLLKFNARLNMVALLKGWLRKLLVRVAKFASITFKYFSIQCASLCCIEVLNFLFTRTLIKFLQPSADYVNNFCFQNNPYFYYCYYKSLIIYQAQSVGSLFKMIVEKKVFISMQKPSINQEQRKQDVLTQQKASGLLHQSNLVGTSPPNSNSINNNNSSAQGHRHSRSTTQLVQLEKQN